jgi:hypothetical protein
MYVSASINDVGAPIAIIIIIMHYKNKKWTSLDKWVMPINRGVEIFYEI